jgi:hypothetical protein
MSRARISLYALKELVEKAEQYQQENTLGVKAIDCTVMLDTDKREAIVYRSDWDKNELYGTHTDDEPKELILHF